MSGTKDLKDLLDRLKGEVGPLPEPEAPQPAPAPRGLQSVAPRPERSGRPERAQEPRLFSDGPQNPAWSENKESMLFGMLSTLTAALGGVLAGLDYLALIGAVFFALFSLLMLLALFRVCLPYGRGAHEAPGLADRVDALSRKVEMLSSRAAFPGGGPASSGGHGKERELEQKVEELRVLVKSLTKAVGLE